VHRAYGGLNVFPCSTAANGAPTPSNPPAPFAAQARPRSRQPRAPWSHAECVRQIGYDRTSSQSEDGTCRGLRYFWKSRDNPTRYRAILGGWAVMSEGHEMGHRRGHHTGDGPVALIGIDSLSLTLLERLLPTVSAPNFRDILSRGAATEVISEVPVWTPTNWATLITGARTGTHGVNDWFGEVPDLGTLPTFDSRAIRCETIFEACERSGLRSLAIQYPGTWPPRGAMSVVAPLPRGLVSLAIAGGVEYVGPPAVPPSREVIFEPGLNGAISADISVKREELLIDAGLETLGKVGAKADGADLERATGNVLMFGGPRPKQPQDSGRVPVEPTVVPLVLRLGVGQDTPTAAIYGRIDDPEPLLALSLGAWSEWVTVSCRLPDGSEILGSLRFKLRSLSGDGTDLSLVRSQIYPAEVLAWPSDVSRTIIDEAGPFLENPSLLHHVSDGRSERDLTADLDLIMEEAAYQVDWLVRAAGLIRSRHGWEFMALHWHFIDNLLHSYLALAERTDIPLSEGLHARAVSVLERCIEQADRLVGGFLDLVGEDGHLFVVSDHGTTSDRYWASVTKVLMNAGLLVRKVDGSIDAERSPIIPFAPLQLRVNSLRDDSGRPLDEEGHQRVQEAAIDALLDWREPTSGMRVIALALGQPHAQLLGIWGPKQGDIVYVFNDAFSWSKTADLADAGVINAPLGPDASHHGPKMPTADGALSSNRAMMIAVGPRIRSGQRRAVERLGWPKLTDVVPTICQVLEIDPPLESQGSVLWDLLSADRVTPA
jgi:Type I phosphodiesterase / nucleotide pyrophosphatase